MAKDDDEEVFLSLEDETLPVPAQAPVEPEPVELEPVEEPEDTSYLLAEVIDTSVLTDASGAYTVSWPLICLLYTSPSPRDVEESRMPSSA